MEGSYGLACRRRRACYAAGGGGLGGLGGGGFGGLGGSMGQPIQLFDHLAGAGEQRRWDDEAKRVLAPGYKDKRQALIYPLFYVLLATKDIARSVRPRVSK